jgi:2-C-methyl-D-erythritol 4-phosphate cytidylyltransferase / 2-C-methyl-D-erythritol 2,4-cyclodiphosphate synthase
MFAHSLRSAARSSSIGSAVLVVPDGEVERATTMAAGLRDLVGVGAVVSGGATRQDSVSAGLGAVPAGTELVLCHDAARPFASPGLFNRVASAVRGDIRGAIPIVASPDTVKRVRDGLVVETLPRDELALVQTPQAFDVRILREVHERAILEGRRATDDAGLLEAAGFPVAAVAGEAMNFKITNEADLRRAEWLVASGDQ